MPLPSQNLEKSRIDLAQQGGAAYLCAIRKLRKAECLLQQILPDWADEVENDNSTVACCEITNKDVVDIRNFLNER